MSIFKKLTKKVAGFSEEETADLPQLDATASYLTAPPQQKTENTETTNQANASEATGNTKWPHKQRLVSPEEFFENVIRPLKATNSSLAEMFIKSKRDYVRFLETPRASTIEFLEDIRYTEDKEDQDYWYENSYTKRKGVMDIRSVPLIQISKEKLSTEKIERIYMKLSAFFEWTPDSPNRQAHRKMPFINVMPLRYLIHASSDNGTLPKEDIKAYSIKATQEEREQFNAFLENLIDLSAYAEPVINKIQKTTGESKGAAHTNTTLQAKSAQPPAQAQQSTQPVKPDTGPHQPTQQLIKETLTKTEAQPALTPEISKPLPKQGDTEKQSFEINDRESPSTPTSSPEQMQTAQETPISAPANSHTEAAQQKTPEPQKPKTSPFYALKEKSALLTTPLANTIIAPAKQTVADRPKEQNAQPQLTQTPSQQAQTTPQAQPQPQKVDYTQLVERAEHKQKENEATLRDIESDKNKIQNRVNTIEQQTAAQSQAEPKSSQTIPHPQPATIQPAVQMTPQSQTPQAKPESNISLEKNPASISNQNPIIQTSPTAPTKLNQAQVNNEQPSAPEIETRPVAPQTPPQPQTQINPQPIPQSTPEPAPETKIETPQQQAELSAEELFEQELEKIRQRQRATDEFLKKELSSNITDAHDDTSGDSTSIN